MVLQDDLERVDIILLIIHDQYFQTSFLEYLNVENVGGLRLFTIFVGQPIRLDDHGAFGQILLQLNMYAIRATYFQGNWVSIFHMGLPLIKQAVTIYVVFGVHRIIR